MLSSPTPCCSSSDEVLPHNYSSGYGITITDGQSLWAVVPRRLCWATSGRCTQGPETGATGELNVVFMSCDMKWMFSSSMPVVFIAKEQKIKSKSYWLCVETFCLPYLRLEWLTPYIYFRVLFNDYESSSGYRLWRRTIKKLESVDGTWRGLI